MRKEVDRQAAVELEFGGGADRRRPVSLIEGVEGIGDDSRQNFRRWGAVAAAYQRFLADGILRASASTIGWYAMTIGKSRD